MATSFFNHPAPLFFLGLFMSAQLFDMEYAEFVAARFAEAEAQADGPPIVFTNRGIDSARIVLRELINRTSTSLEIFTGCLSASVYDGNDITACARKLRPGAVRILYTDQVPFLEISALQLLLCDISSGRIQVRRLGGDGAHRLNHFAISDRVKIRAESDHTEKRATVLLNADREKVARQYNELFETLWARGKLHEQS